MKHILRLFAVLSMAAVLLTVFSCKKDSGDDDPGPLSEAKTITAFSFTNPSATGVIDESARTITVTVPYGTEVTGLIATFSTTGANVRVGNTVQVSGTTPNDFTNPVAYAVTAQDGTTTSYAVTVTINNNTYFADPELVTVMGYTAGSGDLMEPFISRDGQFLFFNDNGASRDIYYAAFVNETTFQFQGAIVSINTGSVDGVPTMDAANKFYYVSVANFDPPTTYDTLYTGTWTGTTVTGSTPVAGLAITTPGALNFDVEVSWDGSTLYFDDGVFSGGTVPDAANIAIAVDSGSGFIRDPNSAIIMGNVNTVSLEYAPAISADDLELFFTRLDLNTMTSAIYRVTRSSISSPFGVPQLVDAIEGFVEAPALSPDQKSLYYHRMNAGSGKFELYRVTRP